jgi:phage terminase large subunit-like protein
MILREQWLKLSQKKRRDYIASLTEDEAEVFYHLWEIWARDAQLAPVGDWVGWIVLAGRGFGKTRLGAEWIRSMTDSGEYPRVSLIARTAADIRDVMVDGESGLLSIYPRSERPKYEPSKRRVTFANGAIASLFSADEPDSLRGPQHYLLWEDELAAWQYPESHDQAMFGLRLGKHPRFLVTTTPKPTRIVRELVGDENNVVTRGSTYDNRANLAPTFFEKITAKYEGSRLGRQELNGEILDDNPNALFNRANIDENRVTAAPVLSQVVVGVDPAVTANSSSNNTGIICAGRGSDGHYYVLRDETMLGKPNEWGTQVLSAYHTMFANRIVGEVNQGGDLVESNIRNLPGGQSAAFEAVRATRGKALRAEPVSTLYEQGRVHHVGAFTALEDEMCNWDPSLGEASPDRLDAMVWAITYLMEHAGEGQIAFQSAGRRVEKTGLRGFMSNVGGALRGLKGF